MSMIRNGLCAAMVSLSAISAQAAVQTVNFDVDLFSFNAAYDLAPGSGTLVYNDAELTNVGEEAMALSARTADPGDPLDYDVLAGLISFSLTLFTGETYQQTFTAADDAEYPDLPEIYFFDGELFGMDFFVDEEFTTFLAPGFFAVMANYTCGCGGEFFLSTGLGVPNELTVVLGEVPVPAALPLMLGGLGLLGLAARRRKG
jgi:hypothetical protein